MWSPVWLKVSQIDTPRPSSVAAPSIWYDDVETPQRKPLGNSGNGMRDPLPKAKVIRTLDRLGLHRQISTVAPLVADGDRARGRAVGETPQKEGLIHSRISLL